jgi:hypothetical protein
LGLGLTTPLLKNIVTKSKEANTGTICQGRHWQGVKGFESWLMDRVNTKLDGIRRVGRPKMRWEDGV